MKIGRDHAPDCACGFVRELVGSANGDEVGTMRKSWRAFIVIALAGVWPQVGCHQLPANKSIQEGPPPLQKGQGAVNKQQLTAEDIGVSLVVQAKALEDAK